MTDIHWLFSISADLRYVAEWGPQNTRGFIIKQNQKIISASYHSRHNMQIYAQYECNVGLILSHTPSGLYEMFIPYFTTAASFAIRKGTNGFNM